jgi:alkylresorcinol/alkylpyrone synthase
VRDRAHVTLSVLPVAAVSGRGPRGAYHPCVRDSVTGFLAEHDLTIDDIASWICHPGGPKVIDAVQQALKLPDQAVAASRRSLAEVGNMSSASVLHILEMISGTERPRAGSPGLMIGLGPGVSAELVLLRW